MPKDSKGLEIVRYYTEDDPVRWDIDNRPLQDLAQRDCDLYNMIQIIINAIGLILVTADESIEKGRALRMSGNGHVVRAVGDSIPHARVIGVAEQDILVGETKYITSTHGAEIEEAQFVIGLVLVPGDDVYLNPSPLVPGAFTNVKPVIAGQVAKPLGVVFDNTGYLGIVLPNSKAKIIFQIGASELIV